MLYHGMNVSMYDAMCSQPRVTTSCPVMRTHPSCTPTSLTCPVGSHTARVSARLDCLLIFISQTCLFEQLKWCLVWQKAEILCNIRMCSIIWANQKAESFVYCWLCALVIFYLTCFPTFVGTSNVISSVLFIC